MAPHKFALARDPCRWLRVTGLAAEKRLNEPVVHNNIADLKGVIPPLVYQKGGWVLHMLRGQIGVLMDPPKFGKL